jgi:hypothetical protein
MISRSSVLAFSEGGVYLGRVYRNDIVWRSCYIPDALD